MGPSATGDARARPGGPGVRVRRFETYFARASASRFTASTQATAVTGTVTTLCQQGTNCGLFPITVPSSVDLRQQRHAQARDRPVAIPRQRRRRRPTNEAIVPLCKDKNDDIGGGSAGSVGWLDLSTALGGDHEGACANNFKDAIENPCIASLPFPTWVQTFPGGVGKGGPEIQDALNAYHDDIV